MVPPTMAPTGESDVELELRDIGVVGICIPDEDVDETEGSELADSFSSLAPRSTTVSSSNLSIVSWELPNRVSLAFRRMTS